MKQSNSEANSLKFKTCIKCGVSSETAKFHPRENRCYQCNYEYMRAWRAENPEKCKEYIRRRSKCPTYKPSRRRSWLKTKYGLTENDVAQMRERQGGKCLICGNEPEGEWRQGFMIDHCHGTGRVRGLLCNRCNRNLGWYERYAASIMKYLK